MKTNIFEQRFGVMPKQLEEFDIADLPEEIKKEIEKMSDLDDKEFINITRPALRAIMAKIRFSEGDKMSGDKWVYHMLPDPIDKKRKIPLIVLPGHGCGYEKGFGGCSMCNFAGEGRDATTQDVDEAIDFILEQNRQALLEDPNRNKVAININAIGSFFHAGEIPEEVRRHIYKRIREYKDGEGKDNLVLFINESRIDHISEAKIQEMREGVGDDVLIDVGVGIESTDSLIRESIINKGLPDNWVEKLNILKKYDASVTAHILFGTPMLDEQQQIADTVRSLKDCLELKDENGEAMIEMVLFMIMNRKPGTLVDYLYRQDRYDLPNILSVAESLIKLSEQVSLEDLKKVMVFGLVGPKDFSEAGVEFLDKKEDIPELNDLYNILHEWRGNEEDIKKVREVYGKISSGVKEKSGYEGPYNISLNGMTKAEKINLKYNVADIYYRISTAFFPELKGESWQEISDFFKSKNY